jgi:hypothetical protein
MELQAGKKARKQALQAHVNRAIIRSGQDERRFKRFLYTCPLQEKGLIFGLYSARMYYRLMKLFTQPYETILDVI